MSDDYIRSPLSQSLSSLKPKAKQPASTRVLNTWIAQAEGKMGAEAGGGRLGWLVASSIAIAAVQRAVDASGQRLFLLKGGTLLQHRLSAVARATRDVDGIVRGDMDEFLTSLDSALKHPWGSVTMRREEVEVVETPTKLIKPRRFDLVLEIRGVTWRRVRFEISPDEAGIGAESESVAPPSLAGFGLPDPDALAGIAMRYQVAQKLHAVSDPHEPPDYLNDRARDVVDLLLIRDLIADTRYPALADVRDASLAVFLAREAEARELSLPTRQWPPTVIALPHWKGDYARAAESGGISLSLDEAVAEVNAWITEIDRSHRPGS